MAHHTHDHKPDFFRQGMPKSGQGVRGGVAYRKLSDSYANDKNYPRAVFVGVNLLLGLLTLAILLALLLAFTPLGDAVWLIEEQVDILYTLEFYDVNGDLSAAPAVGTPLLDAKTGEVLGEITQVSSRPYTPDTALWRDEESGTGTPTLGLAAPANARIVSITVSERVAYEAEVGYSIQGVRIAKGLSYTVSFAGSLATGTCVSIEQRG